jgi:hypothetical protein
MSLFFKDNKEKSLKYIEEVIKNENIEYEIIFGVNKANNPISKQVFMKLLEKCRDTYENKTTTTLDIRTKNEKDIRISLLNIEDIKQYCKTNTLPLDENLLFVKKEFYISENEPSYKFKPIIENEYNFRLTLKKEQELDKTDVLVEQTLFDFDSKPKNYRYKKRFSFTTNDNLFSIDLTVVKTNEMYKKTFQEANILKQPEIYELEIEYIGNKETQSGITRINELYEKLNEKQIIKTKGNSGNLFNPFTQSDQYFREPTFSPDSVIEPIHLINITDENEEEEDGFMYQIESPRSEPLPKLESYKVSSKKYSYDEYNKLIGKKCHIKEDYWETHPDLYDIKEGLKDGNQCKIIDVIERINKEDNYKQTYVKIELWPFINNIETFLVPINKIYGDTFKINEKEIMEVVFEGGAKQKLPSWAPKQKDIDPPVYLDELKNELLKLLYEHFMFLSKIIYDTNIIVPLSTKKLVIQKYKQLNGNKYFKFMGPQPVTLTKECLSKKSPKSILLNYAVTEKADGDRYEMIVFNNHGYLINSKENVIDIGKDYPNLNGIWLFDGEYITKDKDNNPIQLYMIFDIYYCGTYKNLPQPIYTYPFMSESPIIMDRYTVLLDCNMGPYDDDDDGNTLKNVIEVDLKNYECGFNTNIFEKDYKQKGLTDEFSSRIFQASKNILKRNTDGEFDYRIDGLIFLPMRFPVKARNEGSPVKYINGTWDYNFKWKPPEENTIDFKIFTNKENKHNKVSDLIFPLKDNDGIMNEYKKVDLIVGYDYKQDNENTDYCMEILEPSDPNLSKLIKFQHEEANTTNIKLTHGKMICENGDEIFDGDLVEMRYVKGSSDGIKWLPLRSRNRDKKEPQFFKIANNIWDTINDPVTNDMITNGYLPDYEKDIDIQGKYYINEYDDLSESNCLRKLHNYIKSKLIRGIYSLINTNDIHVLDLSIGRGGDIQKYMDKQCKFLLGFDISTNINEACERYHKIKGKKPISVFLRGDTSKNIISRECSEISDITEKESIHTNTMISILYGINKTIPKEYMNISKKYKTLSKNRFHVISSQFSMHYYFKNETTFNGFIQNLNDNIKLGGYFIGTCYDGEKIFEKLKISNMNYENSTGKLVYSVKKNYEIENFTYDDSTNQNMFGNEILVYMDSIGQEIPEYLVNFEFFIHTMKKNNFELVNPKGSINLFSNKYFTKNNMGSFENIINDILNIKQTDNEFRKFYSEAYDIIKYKQLIELSSMNNYFIFKKV